MTHHNANGSTLTEEKHANTISKLDKHFEEHVSQQTFNFNNQMMNLKDTVDFYKESRNARQQDLNVNIQTCENDVKKHTDTHKKLIEEYNVGSKNKSIRIKYLVKKICYILNKDFKSNISTKHDRPFNDYRYAMNSSKIRSLGWSEKNIFNHELEKICKFYYEKFS